MEPRKELRVELTDRDVLLKISDAPRQEMEEAPGLLAAPIDVSLWAPGLAFEEWKRSQK